jgi:hypothetical protein
MGNEARCYRGGGDEVERQRYAQEDGSGWWSCREGPENIGMGVVAVGMDLRGVVTRGKRSVESLCVAVMLRQWVRWTVIFLKTR